MIESEKVYTSTTDEQREKQWFKNRVHFPQALQVPDRTVEFNL